jgi:S-methylmethionine-dependent homocysteine/selenocysteine methylase
LGVGARWRGVRGACPELEGGVTGVAMRAGGAATAADAAPAGGATHSPAELAALARGWLAAGARIVGGCCGTTPEHIRALRVALDAGTQAR